MKGSRACAEWVESLAATHSEDLSYTDRIALNEHLETCEACTETSQDYNTVVARYRAVVAHEASHLVPDVDELRERIADRQVRSKRSVREQFRWETFPVFALFSLWRQKNARWVWLAIAVAAVVFLIYLGMAPSPNSTPSLPQGLTTPRPIITLTPQIAPKPFDTVTFNINSGASPSVEGNTGTVKYLGRFAEQSLPSDTQHPQVGSLIIVIRHLGQNPVVDDVYIVYTGNTQVVVSVDHKPVRDKKGKVAVIEAPYYVSISVKGDDFHFITVRNANNNTDPQLSPIIISTSSF